ncbi:hypothetical protein N7527_005862 [Penicillium freii]|nr:hypothetical protein N7527_005862 [Penicillium freii]
MAFTARIAVHSNCWKLLFRLTSGIPPHATVTIGMPWAHPSGAGSSGVRVTRTWPFLSQSTGKATARSTAVETQL